MPDLAKVFRALSDPTRLCIVNELSRHVLCVGALADRLGVTHSAVSQHLRVLREAGLVRGAKRGYWVHYSLDRRQIRRIATRVGRWLEEICAAPTEACLDAPGCPRKGGRQSASRRNR